MLWKISTLKSYALKNFNFIKFEMADYLPYVENHVG